MTRTKVSLLGMCGAALMLLSACGSSGGGGTSSSAPSSSGGSSAAAPTGNISITWQTTGEAGVKALISAFEKQYPGTKIDAKFVETSAYFSLLRTQLQAGSGSDVFWVNPGNGNPVSLEVLAPNDYLTDLSDQPWTGKVYDGIAKYTKYKGQTMILPTDVTAFSSFYNDQAMKAAGLTIPKTWDEVLKFCRDARAKGVTAYTMGAQDLFETQGFVYSALPTTVYAANPDIDKQLADGSTTFQDSPQWQKTMELYKQAVDAGCYNDKPTGTSFNQSTQNLATGKALGATDAYLIAQFAKATNPQATFTLAPFPVPSENGETWMSVAPMSGFAINKKSANPDLAKAFLAFASQHLDLYTGAGAGSIPAIPTGQPITDPNLKMMEDFLKSGKSVTFVDQMWPNPEVQQAMYTGLQAMITGNGTPQQVLEAMQGAY